MEHLSELEAGSIKGALEALLLVSSDPVSASQLAGILGSTPGAIASLLADLKVEYEEANRGFQLREVAGGWRLFTHPAFHDQVESFVLSWDTQRLSQAALETLAVIAYHQPVTREMVKGIRGVNSDGVISSLVDKGLIREMGRDPQRGQAILYGTTNAFLEKFGLRSTRDLPDLEQFAPDEQARQFIRERLSGRSIQSTLDEVDEDLEEERELISTDEGNADVGATFDGDSFDKDRDGLVPSGGGATVIIESYESAKRRGANILAEVVGYGFSSNGEHISVPNVDGPRRSLEMALKDAGMAARDIQYVNAHATSTPLGDLNEAKAIAEVFREAAPYVASTKSMTGHEMWMAGASEVIYSMLMMQNGFIAPNLNFTEPDEASALLNIPAETKQLEFDTFLSNSFGFGGTNSTLIIRKFKS